MHEIRVYADLPVADGAFHHVAGMIHRKRNRARIFVDGAQCANIAIDELGAVAPANQDVTFGATGNGAALGNFFSGVLDEIRISRVARATFHPVLGEDDAAYRARLKIFRRWTLPSRAALEGMVNQAAPFPTDPAPYQLKDFELRRSRRRDADPHRADHAGGRNRPERRRSARADAAAGSPRPVR